jgi:NAD-dependent SIR2 family protein deacetylase
LQSTQAFVCADEKRMSLAARITSAAATIRRAEAIYITAGAGMGVDSGLPDFRGREGFWKEYPPLQERGLSLSDMARPDWFEDDVTFAWGFYGHRLNLYRQTVPHQGFQILKRWAETRRHGSFVYTSNVDGAFQKAGFGHNVLECHGSIHHLQPLIPRAGSELIDSGGFELPEVDPQTLRIPQEAVPRDAAGSVLRPNVMMFGDWGWDSSRTDRQQGSHDKWLRDLQASRSPAVVIECGAGTAIPTVRRTSESVANLLGCPLIRINPRESQVPPQIAEATPLELGSLDALQKIDAALMP